MPYVYSTATSAITYVEYEPDIEKKSGHSKIVRKVTINGGHGVATKNLITPKGIMTKITDDDFEWLVQQPSFQNHMKRGFMSYDKNKIDPEKKAANMAKGDQSAPLTPNDFEKGGYSDENSRIYTGAPKK